MGTKLDSVTKDDEKVIDTTMILGVFFTGDSTVVTKQMRYEADEEDNVDDELESKRRRQRQHRDYYDAYFVCEPSLWSKYFIIKHSAGQ
jgi:hypothetical protein